jgi:type II secretion system protein N
MKDKPWMKYLKWFGFFAFFIFALLLSIRITFPTHQVREYLRGQMAERLGASSVLIEDVSLVGIVPGGVEVEGLELTLPPVKTKTTKRNEFVDSAPRTLSVEDFTIDGSAIGALGGNFDFDLSGRIQGGEVNGGRFQAEKNGPIRLTIEELKQISLGSEGLFLTLTGLDIVGELSGKVSVELPSVERDGKFMQAWDQLTSDIELRIENAKILQPVIDTAMDRMGFTDVALGTVTLKLSSDGGLQGGEGKASKRLVIGITELSVKGGDVEVVAAQKSAISIMPGQTIRDATINLQLAVRINENFFDKEAKDPKDPTKMTKPNVGLRTMQTMGPLKNHTVDGQFGVSITGPLSKPRIALGRPRARLDEGPSGRKMNVDQPGGDAPPEEEGDNPSRPAKAGRQGRASPERGAPIVRQPSGNGAPVPAAPVRPRANPLDGPLDGGRIDEGMPPPPPPGAPGDMGGPGSDMPAQEQPATE